MVGNDSVGNGEARRWSMVLHGGLVEHGVTVEHAGYGGSMVE